MTELGRELQVATEVAHEAGEVLLSFFGGEDVGTRTKGDRDVVTAADLASEKLVLKRLHDAFPQDGFVGEEGSDVAPGCSRRWLVDPLDGTLNFSRSIPIWCVSLALFDGSIPVLGVIYDPIHGETFAAVQGQGATCNGEPLTSSALADPAGAIVHLTVDFHEGSMLLGLHDLQVLAPRVLRTRNTGSAALALAYVASGRIDVMVHRYAHAWDYAAGVVLVQEAGGYATAIDGTPYTQTSSAVLAAASNALHGQILDVIVDR